MHKDDCIWTEPNRCNCGWLQDIAKNPCEAVREIERLRAELAECREDAENWRMMRRQLGDLIDAAEAGERSVIGACATYIAVCANDVGADNAKFDMDGVTDSAGTECGDWVVTVTRKGEGE